MIFQPWNWYLENYIRMIDPFIWLRQCLVWLCLDLFSSDAAADNAVLITCTGATGALVFQQATVAVGAREVQVS